MSAMVIKPITEGMVHVSAYYKYNGISYKKFPIDLWEDICGWFDKRSKSFYMEWVMKDLIQYTNVKKCPVDGYIYLKANNISVDSFYLPFMPSGRYRIDVVLTHNDRKTLLGMGRIHLNIPDNRIEKF